MEVGLDRSDAAVLDISSTVGKAAASRKPAEAVPAGPTPSFEGERSEQTYPNTLAAALERRLRRLTFDLHDGALQELAALGAEIAYMRRQVVPRVYDDFRDRVDGRFEDVEARLAALDQTLRALMAAVTGDRQPIEALDTQIAREVASLRDETGIEADLEINGSFGNLTESRRIVIFQVVKEALSNIREHSGAEHVSVRVAEREGSVEVAVEDDGRGFDCDAALLEAGLLRRFGLTGMRERVEMLGSELEIESVRGIGTRISFVLDAWAPSDSIS
jgi:signal transduction histidine kinase